MVISNPLILEQLEQWMQSVEGEHFEFKEARSDYNFEKLASYCCALANEGGGKVILGVTDKRPRRVVGTQAFIQPERTRQGLIDRIPLRIEVQEIQHPQGRVLVFDVPARPVGIPIKYDRIYWSRSGDSLVPLSEDRLREIFAESGHDFSADVCRGADLSHLDPQAIEEFRRRWMTKSGNQQIAQLSPEQILRDAELLVDGGVTYAALILFGTHDALGRFLAQAEVDFEYRSSEAAGPAQQRINYRRGFFTYYDDLWKTIDLRNDVQHYQDGLFVFDIPTFAERSVREALLNAVSHRNYQLGGNVFVRQHARRLIVESPGGFPLGISKENVLDRQSPRNRRLADAFARCGLVERSGQGMNLMFEQSIRQGKQQPDFSGTDAYTVVLTLHGEVRDPRFIQFLEQVGKETLASFDTHDFVLLDFVHREEPVPPELKPRLHRLTEFGVVESMGRGRGTRYLLSRRFHTLLKNKGTYTRKKGLDRETNKQLLLKHICDNKSEGTSMEDFRQVLPSHSRGQIQSLLRELKNEKRIAVKGHTKNARYYPVSTIEDCSQITN